LTLNGESQDISTPRTQACLRALRSLRANLERTSPTALPILSTLSLKIVSNNNFPTAAGLASSAAGFAALVRAIADLYILPSSPEQLSLIARQGSGSACRSLLGGYVAWRMGSEVDGSDSIAEEIAPANHWPEMRALILIASKEKKDVSSTAGMQTTVSTSELMTRRVKDLVPRRMKDMEMAIKEKDFEKFAELTMKDSNCFHACCLDTVPPIFYMNDTSRAAVRVVDAINDHAQRKCAAYTFDAGPNAVVYYLEKDHNLVTGIFRKILPNVTGWEKEGQTENKSVTIPDGITDAMTAQLQRGTSGVILTKVDKGPTSTENHLIDEMGNTS